MPTNVFFNHAVSSEQHLYEDLVVESLRMYGHNVYYLPREIIEEDTILGEDVASKFGDAYEIEAYLENVEGFEGEGDLYSKFGVEIRDQATFVIALRTWERFVSLDNNLTSSFRPNEGDVIYFPLSGSLFEIKFVEHEDPFYQIGKLFVFKMRCELFEYANAKYLKLCCNHFDIYCNWYCVLYGGWNDCNFLIIMKLTFVCYQFLGP